MKNRIIAKIIDSLFVGIILTLPIGSYVFAIRAIEIAYEQTLSIFVFTPLVLVILLTLFIYFGVVGKKNNGSIGKVFMKLEIKGENINSFKLFIREPLVQIFCIAIIYRIIFSSVIVSFCLISMIYFVALLLRVDLWNRIFKTEVI